MEPIFENRYIRDKETAKEISASIYFKQPLFLWTLILCGICFAVNLFCLLAGYEYYLYGLIFPPVYAAFWFYSYVMFKNSLIKRDAESYKGDVVITMKVYEDHITAIGADGSEVKLEYGKIKKSVTTKQYIIFTTRARLMYALKNDSFIKGTFEDFITFINSKGIKIKTK